MSTMPQSLALTMPVGSRGTAVACRGLDIVVAGLLLLLLLPALLIVAVAIRIESPGHVLFRQRRLGRGLEAFTMNKFRTMRTGTGDTAHRSHVLGLIGHDQGGRRPMTKLEEDSRITRVGRFLRRTSLDEVPQLINVLRGEMSLVGPRPPIQYEVDHYPVAAFQRFAVMPGITGLWQVSGRSQLSFTEMIALDAEYVRRRSFWLNLSILLRTPLVVLRGHGAA